MKLFKSSPPTPPEIALRTKILAEGRKKFILTRGLGWGLLCFVITTVHQWHHKFGWTLPPIGEIGFSILVGLPIWLAGGYWFGAWMWKRQFSADNQPQHSL